MYNVTGHLAWLPEVKFDSCNNLLLAVHTAWIILCSVILYIKRKYYIRQNVNLRW